MTAAPALDEAQAAAYQDAVIGEIAGFQALFSKRLRSFRLLRGTSLISAASVPVLAAAPQVPRWVLACAGALVAVAEAFEKMLQLHATALSAMTSANQLERLITRYRLGLRPYDGLPHEAFSAFADEVEAVRGRATQSFYEHWDKSSEAGTVLLKSIVDKGPPVKGH